MALKRKITAADFEKLSDGIKTEYKKVGEDYILDIDGESPDDSPDALRRARDREKEDAKAAKAEAAKLKAEMEELKGNDARKNGDVKTLDESWKAKLAERENEHKATTGKLTGMLDTHLRQNVARELASKISNSPSLLMPHILPRIKVDLTGDSPVTRILDAEGKISALTMEDLQKEIAGNKEFAPIIIANRGGGSGGASNVQAPNAQSRFGGAGTGGDGKALNLAKAAPADLVALIDSKKAAT
jgi:hypothetical protein